MSYSKTVAFARWQYPYTLTPEQQAEKEENDKNRKRYYEFPEGSNEELQREFFRQLTEGRKRFIVPEKTYCECNLFEPCYLQVSALSPSYSLLNHSIQNVQPNP